MGDNEAPTTNSTAAPTNGSSSINDNLNVIYDNELTMPELSLSAQANEWNSSDTNYNVFKFGKAQKANKSQDSFFDSATADETATDLERQQPIDQFASCLIEQIGSLADESSSSPYANLSGRLDFWQPIDNSGVMHLVARVRYAIKLEQQQQQQQRKRRESFQAPIKRAPASGLDDSLTDGANGHPTTKQQHQHEIWLPASGAACELQGEQLATLIEGQQLEAGAAERHLIGELISSKAIGSDDKLGQRQVVVDIDAETIVTRFNLTGAPGNPMALADKCLLLFHVTPPQANNKPAANHQPAARQLIGRCKVNLNDKWAPPMGELDHLPSVSVVQLVREDLLGPKRGGVGAQLKDLSAAHESDT